MTEIKKVNHISFLPLYDDIPTVYYRFDELKSRTTSDDYHYLTDEYEYDINYQMDFPKRSKIIGIEVVNFQDFLADPESLEHLKVSFEYKYKDYQGDIKEFIEYAVKEREDVL